MNDQELMQCLERFPDGPPITLYHVDATGNLVAAMERGAQVDLRSGEFWFTTNVEARTGFKGGAGLDNVISYQVDRRFVMLLAELAQDQRTGALAEKGMRYFFNVELAVPRVNFEGGGRGVRLPEGDVNIALRMTKPAPEFNRLFQLSTKQITLLRYNGRLPPGQRLVPAKPLNPWKGEHPAPPGDEDSDPNRGFSGKTPGFNPSKLQGAAMLLQELMAVAERMSMMTAASAAWAEFKDREDEVMDIQNSNPSYATWISFTFTYAGGNADQPSIYRYLPPMVIKSGGSPPKEKLGPREFYHYFALPALKASGPKHHDSAPSNVPAWLTGHSSVKSALQGDPNGWEAESPARAHQVLNGSPMYDMLKILKKLNREDPKLFRLLENTVWNPYGVNNSRNAAAIVAARMADNSSGDAFADYKAACKEFGLLPDDQKKDIEDFLTAKSKADAESDTKADDKKKGPKVPEWLPGWWTVWDGGYYYYYFTDQFTVCYVDNKPSSPNAAAPRSAHNRGKFFLVEHGIKIIWNPVGGSSTEETFTQRDWKSQTEMNGVSNKYSPLFARRMS